MDEFKNKIGSDLDSENLYSNISNEYFDGYGHIEDGTSNNANVIPIFPEDNINAKNESNSFNETIKSEPYTKKKIKKAPILVASTSLVAGTILGLVIGAYSTPQNNNYEQPQFAFNGATETEQDEITTVFRDNKDIGTVLTSKVEQLDYSEIFQMVDPAVVNIVSNKIMSDFYGRSSKEIPAGLGSGIIFHEDLKKVYIATNYHVIDGANSVEIMISGNEETVPATLVGKEPSSDLAVLSIEKSDLSKIGINSVSVATFGDSESTKVGEVVLAIGNALGEGNSITYGLISAKNRVINIQGKELPVIQTSAQINSGNSGGALVNMKGEVIGINTAKVGSNYSAFKNEAIIEGVGYSIASNVAKPILEDLMNEKPVLGIGVNDITEEVAKMYNLPILGVHVVTVFENTGAEKAGIQAGDIIVGFNGQPCLTYEQLQKNLKDAKVGQTVEIQLIRGGTNQIKLNVPLSSSSSSNNF